MDNTPTPVPVSPPSSPSQDWPSVLRYLVASSPGVTASLAALWVVGIPLGQALPTLLTEFVKDRTAWQPLVANLLALGMVAAPVPTLALARSLLGRLPGKK